MQTEPRKNRIHYRYPKSTTCSQNPEQPRRNADIQAGTLKAKTHFKYPKSTTCKQSPEKPRLTAIFRPEPRTAKTQNRYSGQKPEQPRLNTEIQARTQNNQHSIQIFRPEPRTANTQYRYSGHNPEQPTLSTDIQAITQNNQHSLQIFRPELTRNNLDSLQIFRGARPSEEAGERDGGGGDGGVDAEVEGHHDLGDGALRVAIHAALLCGTPLVGHQHHVAVLSELDVDGQGSH